MSWFGGGGGKSDSNGGGSYQPENSYQDQSFVGQQESYSAPRAAAGSAESFQQELLLEQQKALIQAVMFKLTEIAFKKCITTPASSLSSCKSSSINPLFTKVFDDGCCTENSLKIEFVYFFIPFVAQLKQIASRL